MNSSSQIDELRRTFPQLGFAVYAIEPGKPVTFEVYTPDGGTLSMSGRTVDEAIGKMFRPAPPPPEPVSTDVFD